MFRKDCEFEKYARLAYKVGINSSSRKKPGRVIDLKFKGRTARCN